MHAKLFFLITIPFRVLWSIQICYKFVVGIIPCKTNTEMTFLAFAFACTGKSFFDFAFACTGKSFAIAICVVFFLLLLFLLVAVFGPADCKDF